MNITVNPHRIHGLPSQEDITRVELDNGIVVLSRPNFNSPSVFLSGYFECGSLFDPKELLGLADFTAIMLMRGTQQHTFGQIFDILESAGASMSFTGGTHSTGFSGRALVEDLDMLLELLNETIRQPVFPLDYVERMRAQRLTSLAIRAQDTSEMASLNFDANLYANHPYGYSEEGTPETVARITQSDLAAFHKRCYGPKGCVIAIVGGIEPKQAVEKVARVLGDWHNPDQPPPPVLPPALPPDKLIRVYTPIQGKSQSDIVLGTIGPSRRDEDFIAAALGNNILGQFGMYGRIGDSVRERAGLAYYAYSGLVGGRGPGPWYASAGVAPQNVEQAIELINLELSRFVREPVSSEELADVQANVLGRLPLSLESNGGVVSALLNLELYQLGLDYYPRYIDMVRSVTVEQVQATASRFIDTERMVISVAGS